MYQIGNLGHSALLLPASLILMCLLGWARRSKDVLAFLAALAVCLVATLVAKLGFHACAAGGMDVESPSGHASLSTTFYGCLALIIAGGRPALERAAIYATAALLVVLIGASRVLTEAHTLPEVVLGTFIGVICLLVFLRLRGPARLIRVPLAAAVVAIPIGAVAVWAILLAARHWTPEPLIAAAAWQLDRIFGVCG